MTTTEVAHAAGIDKQRVYVAVDASGLPAYRFGRVYRFRRSEVEAWLARREGVGGKGQTQ